MGGVYSLAAESQGGGDLGGGGGLSGFGQNLGGIFGGNGQNSGMFGMGQYRTDPYSVNAQAFAPDKAEQQYTQNLANQAYGNGPSPAQLQMQQGLQQATAQSQALAASQRGISPALAARYAAQNQAGMSQNVAQNTGIMRAQEQLNSMGQLGNELQSQRTGRMGLENLQSGNFNYAQGLNEQAYEGGAKRRSGMMGGIMNAAGAAFGMAQGGEVPRMADGGMPAPESFNHTPGLPSMPDSSTQDAQNQKNVQSGAGKFLSKFGGSSGDGASGGGLGASMGSMPSAMAGGGQVPVQKLGFGGMPFDNLWGNVSRNPFAPAPAAPVDQPYQKAPLQTMAAPQGFQVGKAGQMASTIPKPQAPQMARPIPGLGGGFGRGGFGAGGFGAMGFDAGGKVPGDAKIKGDSLKNDKVPALLSPKEIVLPRSVTMAPDAPEKARAFVAAIMAKKGKMPGKKSA